jgi:hypothetical protein
MTANFTVLGAWMPNTAMADAYLRALVRKVTKVPHSTEKIVVPAGIAEVGELARVLCALNLIPNSKGD